MTSLNDLYDYGYKIFQEDDYFKFSIDSILLAEYVKIKNNMSILDMCTGNAPIPLIIASKNDSVKIDGIEIQSEVYELAKKSVEVNHLENKIEIINEDVKNYDPQKLYDAVVCNPPYFKINEKSYLNENKVKRIARHEEHLTLKECIENAGRLLKSNGTFYMVHRIERLLESIDELEKNKFGIRNITVIFTKNTEKAEFFLIAASKYKKSDLKINKIETQNLKTYKEVFEGVIL